MKKLIFSSEDFNNIEDGLLTTTEEKAAIKAQAKHDAFMKELMDGAKVVYGNDKDGLWDSEKHNLDTHQGLLIDVKKIEKKPCEHKTKSFIKYV